MIAISVSVAQAARNRVVMIVIIGYCEGRSSHRRYSITLK